MPPGKRRKKENSYRKDDSHSSKVHIIKLAPVKNNENQSQVKNDILNYDNTGNTTINEIIAHSPVNQNQSQVRNDILNYDNTGNTTINEIIAHSPVSQNQSQVRNDILNYDNTGNTTINEIIAHSPVSQNVVCNEITHDSSSCEFTPEVQVQDIDFEYDSDDEFDETKGELFIDEESHLEYSELHSTLPHDTSKLNDDGGKFRLHMGMKSLGETENFDDMLNPTDQNIEKKNAQAVVFANMKKIRVFCATQRKLKFQENWLTEFPFIEYDAKNNLMFCKACRKYVNDWRKTSPFVIGNRNFRESMLKYHERSSMHAECQELADTLASEGDQAVDKDLYKEELSHVFKSVYFIFKNKMPYTHYPQLCESQKREGTDFSVYSSHLKVVPLFGKFICMAFEKEVAKKLENVSEFSLIIDASFRRNIESHDLVYLKYLDNLMVKTVFLGVIDTSAKLHDSIYSILYDLFRKYGVTSWVDKIVYLMTDKSDNHMWLAGLTDLIKSMTPQKFLTSVTYLGHKVKYCASVVQNHKISSTFDALLWSIYCYYEKIDKSRKNLTHMSKELDSIVECYGNLPKNSYTTLYYEALMAVEKDYAGFVHLLEFEQLTSQSDAKVRKAGARILSAITRSCFLSKLGMFIDIFSCLNDFEIKLGNENILPYDVHILLDEVCANIKKAANAEGSKSIEIEEELAETPSCFRGIDVTEDGSIKNVLPEIKRFSLDVISYLKSLVGVESLLEKCFIFNVCMWPEDKEIDTFGNNEFLEIFKKFFTNPEFFKTDPLAEWKLFKIKVLSLFPFEARQNSKSVILKMVSDYAKEFPNVSSLLKRILLLNFECTEIKKGYHEMCLNKPFSRSMLSLQSLQNSMMVSMHGPSLNEYDYSLALELFLNSRHRKFRKKIIDKKLLYF